MTVSKRATIATLAAAAFAIACGGKPAPEPPPLPEVTAPTAGAHLPGWKSPK